MFRVVENSATYQKKIDHDPIQVGRPRIFEHDRLLLFLSTGVKPHALESVKDNRM
jgi:hypothetical protein